MRLNVSNQTELAIRLLICLSARVRLHQVRSRHRLSILGHPIRLAQIEYAPL